MIAEIITLITVIGIVFCFGFICSGAIFCCCALSSMNVFGALLCCTAGLLKENYRRHTERYSSSGHAYQNRNYTDVNTHSHNSTYSGAAPVLVQSNDILLAEAYLVAPLAEARIVSENLSVENGTTTNQRNSEFEQSNALERDGGAFPAMIFKDVWAALLFIAQVIVIVYFAVEACLKALKISDPNIAPADGLGTIVVAFAILGALATILGTVCLTIVLRNADYIIEGVMWTNIGACSIGAVLCLASGGGAIFAVVLGITAALNYWYLNSVRDRISFASAVLSVACQAIKDNYIGIVMSAYMLLFAQLVWFILWSIASYGIACQFFMIDDSKNENHGDDVNAEYAELNGGQWTILFLLLLSLHWGSEVVRTLLQTTVNGVIACWWFQPRRSAVVRGALFRSVTTSFGSVCFGSFLVSVIHALRDLLSMIANKRDENGRRDRGAGAALAGCAEFLLHLVEKALKYFNKYAYCYVAGYGMGFLESASKVTTLFQEKGWTAIVNDNLVSNALTFAVLGMTAVTAVLGAFSSIFLRVPLERVGVTDPLIVLSIVGALMGFAVSIVLTNALSSGVAMVFVCMAENPDALKDNHPDEFRTLTVAWFSFHPDNSWMSYGQVQNTSQYNWNSDNSGDRGRGGGGGGLGYNEFQRVQSEYGGPAYGGYGGPVYEGGGSPLSGKGGLIQAPVAPTPALVQARLVSDSTTYSPIQQMQSDQYGTSIHQSQYQHIENVQHSSNEPYSSQGQHVPYTQYTGALPLSSTTKPSTPSAPPMI